MNGPGGALTIGTGGYIALWNWAITPGVPGGYGTDGPLPGTPASIRQSGTYHFLDVFHWELFNQRVTRRLAHSGACGARRRELIVNDWTVKAQIAYRYNAAIDTILIGGNTLSLKLSLAQENVWTGYPLDALLKLYPSGNITNSPGGNLTDEGSQSGSLQASGLGILPAGPAYIPSYQAPVAIWADSHVIDSSADDDIVIADVTLEGASLLWYLDSETTESQYRQYLDEIAYQIAGED